MKSIIKSIIAIVLLGCILSCNESKIKSNSKLNTQNLDKRILYINNNKKVFYYKLDSSAVREMGDVNFKKQNVGDELYEIAEVDSGILVKSRNSYLLYTSLKDLLLIAEIPQGQSYLTGLNPYDKNVFDKEEEIIKKLCVNLNIERSLLNYEPSSLHVLDEALVKFRINDEFIDSNFLGIYLYLGQVIKKVKGYDWGLNYSKQDDVWEPIILDKMNKEIPVGIALYEEFENYRIQAFADPVQSTYYRFASRASF